MEKTANQLWRESGTTLPFKEWINREKSKFVSFNGAAEPPMMVNKPLNDSVQQALSEARKSAGYKDSLSGKTVFGINKTVLIVGGVLVVALVAYSIAKSKK